MRIYVRLELFATRRFAAHSLLLLLRRSPALFTFDDFDYILLDATLFFLQDGSFSAFVIVQVY